MRRIGQWLMGAIVCLIGVAPAAAQAENRVALVIGNGAYQHSTPLANPLNDGRDMAVALKANGFQVIESFDADKRAIDRSVRDFADKLAKADVALFFYAGHGLQVGSHNYLVPVDAKLERERDLEFEGVRLDFILRQMEIDREGKTNIVFLDACRDNPLARNLARSMGTRSAAIGRGLAAASTGLGTFIAYATQPGNVALDGEGTRNSPFSTALLKHMSIKGRNLPATMIEVRKDVVAATKGQQVPWDHSALTGDFYFVPGQAQIASATAAATPATSTAEVAALQERLKGLEEEIKRRPSAAAGADAMKLAELRARAANLEDLTKELQRKLLSARMEEAKTTDPSERARRSKQSIDIQMEMTRRSLDLKKLKEEMVSLEGKLAPGLETSKRGGSAFVVRSNNRLEGQQIAAPPSTANCETRCQSEQTCGGWHLSRDGICELFGTVTRRVEEAGWRSGVKSETVPAAVPVGVPPVQPKAAAAAPQMTLDENVRIDGNRIAEARQPNADACRQSCEATSGCVGYQHGRKSPMMGQCQLFDRIDARQQDERWRSGVRGDVTARPTGVDGGGVALKLGVAPIREERGFAIYEGSRIEGDQIKMSNADSLASCQVVCRNTAGCVAATYNEFFKGKNVACLVFRSVSGLSEVKDGTTTTAVKVD